MIVVDVTPPNWTEDRQDGEWLWQTLRRAFPELIGVERRAGHLFVQLPDIRDRTRRVLCELAGRDLQRSREEALEGGWLEEERGKTLDTIRRLFPDTVVEHPKEAPEGDHVAPGGINEWFDWLASRQPPDETIGTMAGASMPTVKVELRNEILEHCKALSDHFYRLLDMGLTTGEAYREVVATDGYRQAKEDAERNTA